VVHWPTLFSVALFPVIVLVYGLLARREERQVLARFGDEYLAYRRRVPMFFPSTGRWRELVDRARGRSDDKGPSPR
jgi:protein-S-isoprenylcysteine O-methyltransferase Ste14